MAQPTNKQKNNNTNRLLTQFLAEWIGTLQKNNQNYRHIDYKQLIISCRH